MARGYSAIWCPRCSKERAYFRQKAERLKRIEQDPDYYRKQSPYKRDWARRRQAKKPPLHCVVCGVELPRIIGRRPDLAVCATDRRLNRQYRHHVLYRRNLSAATKAPHRCIGDGVRSCDALLPRVKGRSARRARCKPCQMEVARRVARAQRGVTVAA